MTAKAKTGKAAETVAAEEALAETNKITESARDFVKHGASSAKERSDTIHEGSLKLNSNVEKAMTGFVTGYASFLGNLADAAHANIEHALVTVEKVAAAKSVPEALKIQADFVRENANSNFERVRDAANTSREMFVDGASSVGVNLANAWPYDNKAA